MCLGPGKAPWLHHSMLDGIMVGGMHSVSMWYLYYLLHRKLLDSVDSLVYGSCIRAMRMIGYSFFIFPHNVNFNCWLHKMN